MDVYEGSSQSFAIIMCQISRHMMCELYSVGYISCSRTYPTNISSFLRSELVWQKLASLAKAFN